MTTVVQTCGVQSTKHVGGMNAKDSPCMVVLSMEEECSKLVLKCYSSELLEVSFGQATNCFVLSRLFFHPPAGCRAIGLKSFPLLFQAFFKLPRKDWHLWLHSDIMASCSLFTVVCHVVQIWDILVDHNSLGILNCGRILVLKILCCT